MFLRKKVNKSGVISVQIIDKSSGKYKVYKTIGSSSDLNEVDSLFLEGRRIILEAQKAQEFDFTDYRKIYSDVLSSIVSQKTIGIQYVLGKIFNDIGFNQIKDNLFKDLVLYRLVYPKSKLKTTEYLYRYEQKLYSEDVIYRFMDKLNNRYKDKVQEISIKHTQKILDNTIQAVFYDVTTIYFEIEREDQLRIPGFSKDGKHSNPQILLGLLVSKNAYPLAYDIFEGNKFEGDTFIPILDKFREKFKLEKLTVIADAGLLSQKNIQDLINKKYEFIIGARIKNEKESIKQEILNFNFKKENNVLLSKDNLNLIVTYSEKRAKKDSYNREKGLKKLEKLLKSKKLTKSSINNRGYNKFLEMDGEISLKIDDDKIKIDEKWDGLKGYITNSSMNKEEILENYKNLWQIEKAFRVAKSELKIRPIFHFIRERIEAHICLNFVAYKIYKELERILKLKKSTLSPEKVIQIIQNITQISVLMPDNDIIDKTLILTEEQKIVQELFDF
jgi:transposase